MRSLNRSALNGSDWPDWLSSVSTDVVVSRGLTFASLRCGLVSLPDFSSVHQNTKNNARP